MIEITETFMDKSKWGPGLWQHEPDKLEWRYNGMPCLIVRNPMGALCGYAGVGPNHPWHDKSYTDCVKGCAEIETKPLEGINGTAVPELLQKCHMERKNYSCREEYQPGHTPESIIDVHGGLTYSDFCRDDGKICHMPQDGEPEKVKWFGFDCAHAGDLSPKYVEVFAEIGRTLSYFGRGDVYRSITYVKAEVESLADQLLAVR